MLREVLLALLGHAGDVIAPGPDGVLRVVPGLPFLHPSEAAAVDRLVVMGSHYASLNGYSGRVHAAEGARDHSLLVSAFAAGVDEVLDRYRAHVLAAEKAVIADQGMTLAHLTVHFAAEALTLPALAGLAAVVHDQRLVGGRLLEAVYEASVSGIPEVADMFSGVLAALHRCLLGLMKAWMVDGVLDDPASEWFVAPGSAQTVDGDDDGASVLTNWNSSFTLRVDGIPSYLPATLAEKVLFAGKAVQVLRAIRRRKALAALLGESSAASAFPLLPSDARSVDAVVAGSSSGSATAGNQPAQAFRLLSDAELERFALALDELALARTFKLSAFKATVEDIRTVLAGHLFDLIVHEADLLGHIGALKNYFLLGRGELYHSFLADGHEVLASPVSPLGAHELRAIYVQAGAKSSADGDHFFEHVSLAVELGDDEAARGGGGEGGPDAAWRAALSLHYDVPSPVHLVLDEQSMALYGQLFSFLLAVKRVQLALQGAWMPQMRHKNMARLIGSSAPVQRVWMTRARMAFLIDNLQYYLQADVLEAQHSVLVQAVEASRDFEAVKAAHTRYINNLVALAFLRIKPVYSTLLQLFDTCIQYARLLMTAASSSAAAGAGIPASREAALSKAFDRQSHFLFTVLSGVKQVHAAPHLAQLLLRIDFNRHFSSAMP
ncbi:tubulin [Thecamonas trahens ATCC 50062]|uniref:Spindle pole body component n=1 Tax=Thecamonas trahens ATCC 50062 TaxID=461836 RepID=A0A0L0DVJ8_THETB|nr:tubulin [Thecamonas trahens ATCC 50062]KNC56339.1 tubulin [Thecamonas trahens ATCC 50062]|eukprot:XP_013760856.1 tubulin [Thecamonas trahens ATCC 50062]